MAVKLGFGLREIPDGVLCAWGARAIWPNDIVWDRQSWAGTDAMRDELQEWINAGPFAAMRERLANPYALGLSRDGTDVVTVYEDERGIIRASAQRSYGYVYIAAWLKEHVVEEASA